MIGVGWDVAAREKLKLGKRRKKGNGGKKKNTVASKSGCNTLKNLFFWLNFAKPAASMFAGEKIKLKAERGGDDRYTQYIPLLL